MKTNRPMRYKFKAATYAHDLVTAPPWGNPAQRMKTTSEVVAYWSSLINAPGGMANGTPGPDGVTALKANISNAYEAGYRQALLDKSAGINGEERMPANELPEGWQE